MGVTSEKRQRVKHTRSKQGCRVCRIRRVRCDQTRPACVNCTSTSRTCEGYPVIAGSAQVSVTHMLLPRAIYTAPELTSDSLEQRSFSYFKTQTLPQFSAPFRDEFWTRLVLQFSCQEPAVRHLLVALGALHESFEEEHSVISSTSSLSRSLSLRNYSSLYYSKALVVLNTYISNHSWDGLAVSLACCIICIGFEWLRGEKDAALAHLRSGLLILDQWSQGQPDGASYRIGTSPSSPTGHLIRGHIAPTLLRLTLQARTADHDIPSISWQKASMPSTTSIDGKGSVQGARVALNLILSEVYLQTNRSSPPGGYGVYSIICESARHAFTARLTEWYHAHSMHLYEDQEELNRSTEQPQIERVSLSILYITVTILLATSHTTSQMSFDAFLPQFSYLVRLCSILLYHDTFATPKVHTLTHASPHLNPSPMARFRVDMDTLPMLMFTATKCRHPHIRRKAIALLRAGSSREGLFDGCGDAKLAEEIMLIEEEGIEAVLDENSVPAEKRVCRIEEKFDLERKTLWLRFARQGVPELGEWKMLRW